MRELLEPPLTMAQTFIKAFRLYSLDDNRNTNLDCYDQVRENEEDEDEEVEEVEAVEVASSKMIVQNTGCSNITVVLVVC